MSGPDSTKRHTSDSPAGQRFDGITIADNPTPLWWRWLFSATVLFSLGYIAIYHLGTLGTGVAQAYENEKTAIAQRMTARMGQLDLDEPTILSLINDADAMRVGAAVFKQNCVTCHGPHGEGLNGPNLTDDYYKSVRDVTDIGRVLQRGVSTTAMLPWESRLHPNELVTLTAYVASLRGQNRLGPRGPEGEPIPPWPITPAPDTP